MSKLDNRLSVILNAGDDKRAFNISIMDISQLTTVADYFVILSGNSDRQVVAIAEEIEGKMDQQGYATYHKEGYKNGRWILLDYGDIIVHVFHKEDREFYNLERLWIDGKKLKIDDMV